MLDEVIPSHVAIVAVRLLAGWRPELPELVDHGTFTWRQDDTPYEIVGVTLDDDELRMKCRPSAGPLNRERRDNMLSGACTGQIGDSEFRCKLAHVTSRHFSSETGHTLSFTGHAWRINNSTSLPRVWLAKITECRDKNIHHNLDFRVESGDRLHGYNCGAIRFVGNYDYYVLEVEKGLSFLLVDLRNNTAQDPRSAMFEDISVLEFVLGGCGRIGAMCGIDDNGDLVSWMSRPTGLRASGGVPDNRALPVSDSVWTDARWLVDFFAALSSAHATHPEYALNVAMGFYLNSIDGIVELQALQLHVGLEGLAHKLQKAKIIKGKSYRTGARHKEWISWCDKYSEDIKQFAASPGEMDRLLGAVKRADSSSIVRAAFVHYGIELPPELVDELEVRNDIVHTAGFSDDYSDIERTVLHCYAPRTMLIALLAKVVGYAGPIRGYAREPISRELLSPPWWHAAPVPTSFLRHQVFVTLPDAVPLTHLATLAVAAGRAYNEYVRPLIRVERQPVDGGDVDGA